MRVVEDDRRRNRAQLLDQLGEVRRPPARELGERQPGPEAEGVAGDGRHGDLGAYAVIARVAAGFSRSWRNDAVHHWIVWVATRRSRARMRRARSSGGIETAISIRRRSASGSYGLTRTASRRSLAAPANSERTRTPGVPTRQATYSLATRFMPSRSGVTSATSAAARSEEHTSELQSPDHLVCRLLLEKKNNKQT